MILTHITLFKFIPGATLGTPPPPPPPAETGGGTSRRKKRRVIRLSDLDERERQEALAAIPVRPFDEIERAAAALAEADEEEQEEDELILLAITRLYH